MWQKISNFGALLGILGISGSSLWGDAYKSHVALAAWVITCGILLVYGVFTLRRFQTAKYPTGYIPVATFVRYSTTDGKHLVHETFRQIQIKHAYLSKVAHKYMWTGTKPPTITSSLQRLGTTVWKDVETNYDAIDVHFQHTRYFNDTEILHLRSTVDDSDEQSETFCSLFIDHPIKVAHFRVELLHCGKPAHSAMCAHIERRGRNDMTSSYEPIERVQFDITSRSFEYLLPNPEPGYYYRIRWDRPQPQRVQQPKKKRP